MDDNSKAYKTVGFGDGSYAVVRTNPVQRRVMEVVATFYDASRARSYAETANEPASGRRDELGLAASRTATKKESARLSEDLSDRQGAVLKALHANMDDGRRVAVKAAVLAEAAKIPLGSLHSVLSSLEKKQRILTARQGSARAPAVYQVL